MACNSEESKLGEKTPSAANGAGGPVTNRYSGTT